MPQGSRANIIILYYLYVSYETTETLVKPMKCFLWKKHTYVQNCASVQIFLL